MRRIIGILLAFVMIFMSVSALEGVVMVKAAGSPAITVSEVTITGTMGTPIEEQTIEITVENSEFDPDCFYVGQDISDCFVPEGNPQGNSYSDFQNMPIQYSDMLYLRKWYYKPIGLEVHVTAVEKTKLTCVVSGTPLSPSDTSIEVKMRKTMFTEWSSGWDPFIDQSSSSAYWKVVPADDSGSHSVCTMTATPELSTLDLSGKAGETSFDIDFTLNLTTNAVFIRDIPAGTDVSNWFAGDSESFSAEKAGIKNQLPAGLSVTVTSDVKIGDKTCSLKLSGTPAYGSQNLFVPYIPYGYIAGADSPSSNIWKDLEKVFTKKNGYYNMGCFDIKSADDELPFIEFNSQNVILFAGSLYGDSNYASIPMNLYNGYFKKNPDKTDNTQPWYVANKGYLYSNTEGNLDTDAPGFMYSSTESIEYHCSVRNIYYSGYQQGVTRKFSFQFGSNRIYKVGEYDLTYFVPLNTLDGYDDNAEGYTPVVKSGAKLIVVKPVQLEVDDADIVAEKSVDKYITVKIALTSRRASNNRIEFKSDLTTETLKYTVSDKLKAHGLDLTPVSVKPDMIVFHLTGEVTGKAEKLNIADCLTINHSNFNYPSSLFSTYFDTSLLGNIEINPNPDAVITVTGKAYGVPGQEIDYSPREDVKIYPKNKSGAKVETTYINMTQEKLVTDMSIKCYSTDGGTKWKEAKSALNEKGFQKLLLKGMTFAIADKWDSKEKAPASDAVILTFDKTEKQATKPKFKIDYVTYADATGETTGQFILTDAEGTAYTASALRSTYEIGIASGKSLNEDGYGVWPVNGGLTIAKVESNKVQKTVYYIRTAATTTAPASKEVKISVSGQQKAPNLKIDYKKEVIKGKEGLTIRCGETYLVKNISKEDAKDSLKEISIATYLTVGERAEFDIWLSATAKKPASAIQTINAAARAAAATSSADVVTISNGKLSLKKGYEAYDTDKQKWGGLPKIEASCVISIRKKADAKAGKENDTTYASGETMKLEVTYGVTDASKDKSGVTAAILESEKNASQSSGSGENSGGSGGNTGESGGNTQ